MEFFDSIYTIFLGEIRMKVLTNWVLFHMMEGVLLASYWHDFSALFWPIPQADKSSWSLAGTANEPGNFARELILNDNWLDYFSSQSFHRSWLQARIAFRDWCALLDIIAQCFSPTQIDMGSSQVVKGTSLCEYMHKYNYFIQEIYIYI